MGQVLPVFAHCSSPSPAAGGNDDSDFRELHTAREFSEEDEEETTSQDWGTPRELTFSYIAFDGVVGSGGRRDSTARRPRPQGRSVSEPRDQHPQPSLGDSLESIPSLSQSPEPGRRGDPDTAPPSERPLEDLRLRLDKLGWVARGVGSGEDSSTSSSTPLEDEEPEEPNRLEAGEAGEELDLRLRLAQSSPPEVLTPQLSAGSGTPQAGTPSPSQSRDSNSGPEEPLLEEEEKQRGPLEREPIRGQCFDSTDQLEFTVEPRLLGTAMEWLKTSLLLAVYKTVPILELSPPLWTAIGWWAKSPRSSGVPSLSLGADMGSKGGLAKRAGRGLRSAEGGPDSPLSPAPPEHVCYWSASPALQAGARGPRGSLGRT
uniref:Reticulon 2 n=1 Tax=Rhinopithecus bieti TaxID=61621 RepID=A0A2K6LBG6_RHIBE